MNQGGNLTIHIDGAARGNPGPAAFAYVIRRDGLPLARRAGRLGSTTNNLAEYTALVRALAHAATLKPDRVLVKSDSELVVKQMKGMYKVKNEGLRVLYEEARELARQIPGLELTHVRREENSEADQLCNDALDGIPTDEDLTEQDPGDQKPKHDDADTQAVAYLTATAEAWAKGKPFQPTPAEAWGHLLRLQKGE
jgi:ribonuclease HI